MVRATKLLLTFCHPLYGIWKTSFVNNELFLKLKRGMNDDFDIYLPIFPGMSLDETTLSPDFRYCAFLNKTVICSHC